MRPPSVEKQQQATCGRSLSSNYAPPCLENKFLASVASTVTSSSLQPSSLSSTTSSLLSTSPFTSPLLSTENKLLTSDSPRLSFSLVSSVPHDCLLSKTLASGALLNRFARPPSFLDHGLGLELKRDVGGEEGREEISEEMLSSYESTTVQCSEDDDSSPDEEEDGSSTSSTESPVLEIELVDQDLEQSMDIRQDEFPEVDGGDKSLEEDLKDKKYLLLNEVCCSLVSKNTAPGQKDWDSEGSVWTRIINLAKDISVHDQEFLLKVAVYARQELNIRITANFLLSVAASQPSTKPHVRRYFCAAVQLPTDWLEVVRIYSTCFSHSLPMCLKKAMADKFKQFSEYQLAKYNTRKQRCKHSPKIQKRKKPSDKQMKQWADLLRSEPAILQKFMHMDSKSKVDKKQSEFSIKKMIKRLHIKEPAEHVMAILGKKYPADLKVFTHSGMKGVWDRERVGRRMKLKQPETWERLLSLEGNKAATWEKLIDNKSIPFMAMLRNLRNMITQGISEAHHRKILSRLTNKNAVIQSRQFPFRFLAAYKVIMELQSLASASEKAIPSMQEILKDILKKIPGGRRSRRFDWNKTSRSRLRVTLGVPFIYRKYKAKKAQLLKANQKQYTVALLQRYRKALETAVQICCRYNVPPLPGRTVILLSSNLRYAACSQKLDFCLPPEPKKEEEEEEESTSESEKQEEDGDTNLTPSVLELAVLLSLMIRNSAEDSKLHLFTHCQGEEAKLDSDVLLENVRSVTKQVESTMRHYEDKKQNYLYEIFSTKSKIDNIILLDQCWDTMPLYFTDKYRKEINNKALVVQILLGSDRESERTSDRNHVRLKGFSEQILRFVAERGSARLMDHVEHLDKLYKVPAPEGAKCPQTTSSVVPIPASPKFRWQGVRVFISSTFRDMHAERDVLVRSVFPELRRRAAAHRLYVQEVELRWGVTEEESGRATQLCLSEVCRSHMMVAMLGERYGLVPLRPALPDLPQYSWMASAPDSLSVTEMEIRQFQNLFPDSVQQRMLCYFRDPKITKSVPVAWKSDFVPESKEAESKMALLKSMIRASDVKVTENYPCEWGGVVEGKPYLKNLEAFGKAVLEDLWMAVVTQFVDEDEEAEAASDVTEQEMHQGALRRQMFGRAKQLTSAVEMVGQIQAKGGMMVVEGAPGEGKTVFTAALADALRTGLKSQKKPVCDVISYSTAASQSGRSVENFLRCLIQWFRKINDTEKKSPLPHSYKDMVAEFHSALRDVKPNKPVVLVVDGLDVFQDVRGQLSSDWIPQQLPQGVCLVVSVTSGAALLRTLTRRRSALLFTLGPLTVPDRRNIVQNRLDTFGKKLSDSAFKNQLQTLIMKKGAVSPLYLHLACEDLRNFASFDKLNESLRALPPSLSQLVQHSLQRLCSEHRCMLGLRWALAALTVSPTGLMERDLYSVLNTCNYLSSRDGQVSWQEVLQLARKPKGRVAMTTFSRIVQSLQSLIVPSHHHNSDAPLALTHPEVRQAFEEFLLTAESDRTRAHLVLAAHLWTLADPQGTHCFLHCEANSVSHLLSNLIQCGQMEVLQSLLSNYYFLYANVRHGLLYNLLEIYSVHNKAFESAPTFESLEACRSFLQHHAPVLSSCPNLFVQQAFNEPPGTWAHTWARGLVGTGGIRVVELLNNRDQGVQETSKLVSTFSSEPTCLAVSLDGELVVVGTGQGMLHFIDVKTGKKVKSVVSSCDGISSCVLLKDGRLATTSFDGRIEMWDIGNGCSTALIDGHTRMITASDVTADHKHLATVSLDFMLKVWSSTKGHEVASLPSSSPLNCVTFDPEGHLLAAGCWNGNVIVWNWLQNKTQSSLCGHQSSVRSLSFSSSSSSSSSSMLCSGSISGEVRLWSVPTSTCVGCFQAHYGATEALTFLDGGAMLLSSGTDHTLQLWSGGLGRSIVELKSDKSDQEPPQKKLKTTNWVNAALCVSVNGDYAAVGYHGHGIKLFSLSSGKMIWSSRNLDVSILCLLWVDVRAGQTGSELLVSGGSDKRLRVWRRRREGEGEGMKMLEMCGVQPGAILALAQNSTYLATASDDVTIVLWLLSDLLVCAEPRAMLRGHNGAVTCLAFSPNGAQLLSGGKDQALMVWDINASPPVLSKTLPHSHRDWITGCIWTPDFVISSSNDGRLCSWDLQAGQCLREISWGSPLTSVCSQGEYVIASCAGGGLHVWMWERSIEICHITAHKQRIHGSSLLTDKNITDNPGEITVVTASDDGTVRLWKPLQMQHFNTFQGHSGAIHGVVLKQGVPEFLSVSEDCSLRSWTWTTESPGGRSDPVTALCFSQKGDVCLTGQATGLLELWQYNTLVCQQQVSDCRITAVCSMPHDQFAVSYEKCFVDVWKVVWNQQHNTGSLVKVTTYTLKSQVINLFYCSVLLGVSYTGTIFNIGDNDNTMWRWEKKVKTLGFNRNDQKSVWILGEDNGEIHIGFVFTVNQKSKINEAFNSLSLMCEEEEEEEEELQQKEEEEEQEEEEGEEQKEERKEKRKVKKKEGCKEKFKGILITAATLDQEFVVCGDMKGNMWLTQLPVVSPWSCRKFAHSDKISVLRLTSKTIISASYDGTVKLWHRITKKQVGMFVCGGPVVFLEVNPEKPNELVCADKQGKLYFLSWRE